MKCLKNGIKKGEEEFIEDLREESSLNNLPICCAQEEHNELV